VNDPSSPFTAIKSNLFRFVRRMNKGKLVTTTLSFELLSPFD